MEVRSIEELKVFATDFIAARPQGAVVGLSGELGAGKTTLVRCCIEALARASKSAVPNVISPTFVFHQRYAPPINVEHFDLYRLEKATESQLIEVGYYDALERAQELKSFVFVEWPEKASLEMLRLTEAITIVISPTARILTQTIYR